MMLRFGCAALLAAILQSSHATPAAPQTAVAVPVHSFRVAGTPDAALAQLRAAVEGCWGRDYASRAAGPYVEHAEIARSAAGGTTVRLEWRRLVDEKPAGLLKRAFDIALAPDGAATRITVLVYGPFSEVGRDVERWLRGGAQCFERNRPSP